MLPLVKQRHESWKLMAVIERSIVSSPLTAAPYLMDLSMALAKYSYSLIVADSNDMLPACTPAVPCMYSDSSLGQGGKA